jgi:hypothetical protein
LGVPLFSLSSVREHGPQLSFFFFVQQGLKGIHISQDSIEGASKVSVAKKAVDSTIRRILVYTVEIFAAIILLVLVCLPLVFAIPIWFQWVFFGTTGGDLLLNPITLFGAGGAVWVTAFLGLVSMIFAYPYLMKIASSGDTEETVEEEEEEEAEEEDEEAEQEVEAEEDVEVTSDSDDVADDETEDNEEKED